MFMPCIQVTNALIFGGAKIAVQWYCAPAILGRLLHNITGVSPAIGHIEAISAKDRAVAIIPVMERSIPHTRDEGPPFCNPGVNPLNRYQHL